MSTFKERINDVKQYEIFSEVAVPEDSHVVLRLLGRNFAKLTTDFNIKPYDWEFGRAIITAAQSVMFDLSGLYGYISQGQVFILLRKFSPAAGNIRQLERLTSLASAIATSTFVKETRIWTQFETKVLVFPTTEEVLDYFYLQYELSYARCARVYARYALLAKGLSPAEAHQHVVALPVEELIALFSTPEAFDSEFEAWKRYGIATYWGESAVGYNQRLHKLPEAQPMSVVVVDKDLPAKDKYYDFLRLKIQYKAVAGQTPKDAEAFTVAGRY